MTKDNPNKIIGFGGFFVSDTDGKLINNLGYRFEPNEWGKGYATELSRRAISYGFDEVGLKDISAFLWEDNLASKRVLEKVGMRFVERSEKTDNEPTSLTFRLTYDEWLAYGGD